MILVRKFSTWRQLSCRERRLALEASVVHSATRVCIHAAGLKAWRVLIGRAACESWHEDPVIAIPLARAALDRATRNTRLNGTCLSRSLTLWWLCRRLGVSPDLRLGVCRREGVAQAHAWLQWQGKVINDRPDVAREYAVLPVDLDTIHKRRP